ncbi:MAG: integrase arm-type DNA-binding domain-containing protein [Rhizobiales bacterium]|nr:integrase arm-type DNA-binding domain-containing protein [Hyphomicrobiales bacterium]
MARMRFSDATLKALRPPAKGQADYFDASFPAFGVRVSRSGTKAFFVFDRIGGKLKRMTLGRYPALGLADARQKALDWKAEAEKGIDPAAMAKALAAEAANQKTAEAATTFGAVVEQFLAGQANRLRPTTMRQYRAFLTGSAVAAWTDRQLASITRADVSAVLDKLDARGLSASSNHALACLRRFFNWAVNSDRLDRSPVERMRARNDHVKRDRALSASELATVLAALGDDDTIRIMDGIDLAPMPDMFKDFYRALIFTGQRRGEVAGMTYAELDDLDNADAARWIIPSARTKNKREHIVPLAPPVVAMLKERKAAADKRAAARAKRQKEQAAPPEYVFAGYRFVPLSGFSKAKRELDARIAALRTARGLPALSDWTAHDLRRTVVTMMNEKLAVPPHVVEAIVNHISGVKAGVAGVYNRALYLPERRAALNAWAEYVGRLETGG